MSDDLTARSEILSRIRSALGTSPQQAAAEAWEAIRRDYIREATLLPAQRMDLLVERLRDYGAAVTLTQPDRLASTIGETLRNRMKKRIVIPIEMNTECLSENTNGCTFVPDEGLSYAEIDRCDGVVTGSTAAIAATGTLCICHAPNSCGPGDRPAQGRRALTLIPDYHLCIVRASDVVETVAQAMLALEAHQTEPITLISGPSATSDIEMTRIQGVHGPRVLDVVIVTESPVEPSGSSRV